MCFAKERFQVPDCIRNRKFVASLLTEPFVAVEQVTEPDLHFADFGIQGEMFDGPFVVRH